MSGGIVLNEIGHLRPFSIISFLSQTWFKVKKLWKIEWDK